MFTIKEASDITGVKVRTIRSWIDKGILVYTRFPGTRRIAIPESEIEKMIKRKVPNFCIKMVDKNNFSTKKRGEEIRMVISQREGKQPQNAFDISCHINKGLLITTIRDAQGDIVAEFATEG